MVKIGKNLLYSCKGGGNQCVQEIQELYKTELISKGKDVDPIEKNKKQKSCQVLF